MFNAAVLGVCLALGNRLRHVRMPLVTRRSYDIPLRAGMVALLVATVVGLSTRLGPTITGMLAVFPIVLLSLTLILHPRIGGPAAGAVLSNTMLGLVGFSCTCLTVRLLVVPLGTAARPVDRARRLGRLQSGVLVAAAGQAAAAQGLASSDQRRTGLTIGRIFCGRGHFIRAWRNRGDRRETGRTSRSACPRDGPPSTASISS